MLYLHSLGAPADGLVEVLNLGRTVLNARVLASSRPLEWEQQIDLYFGTNLRVHLPAAYHDPYDTVIALTLAGSTRGKPSSPPDPLPRHAGSCGSRVTGEGEHDRDGAG